MLFTLKRDILMLTFYSGVNADVWNWVLIIHTRGLKVCIGTAVCPSTVCPAGRILRSICTYLGWSMAINLQSLERDMENRLFCLMGYFVTRGFEVLAAHPYPYPRQVPPGPGSSKSRRGVPLRAKEPRNQVEITTYIGGD
jgi:hypothetical protein